MDRMYQNKLSKCFLRKFWFKFWTACTSNWVKEEHRKRMKEMSVDRLHRWKKKKKRGAWILLLPSVMKSLVFLSLFLSLIIHWKKRRCCDKAWKASLKVFLYSCWDKKYYRVDQKSVKNKICFIMKINHSTAALSIRFVEDQNFFFDAERYLGILKRKEKKRKRIVVQERPIWTFSHRRKGEEGGEGV